MELFGSAIETGGAVAMNEANRSWAENMSNTQYQRAVEDMKAAGLNPVLAAGTGGASFANPSTSNPTAGLANSLTNAKRFQQVEKPIAEAEAEQKKANTDVSKKVAERTVAETKLTQANTRATIANAKAVESGQPERDVKAVPWQVGDAYLKGAKDSVSGTPQAKDANWIHQQAGRQNKGKVQTNPADAYTGGRGTVAGGSNSAVTNQRSRGRERDQW